MWGASPDSSFFRHWKDKLFFLQKSLRTQRSSRSLGKVLVLLENEGLISDAQRWSALRRMMMFGISRKR